jgi:tRNA (guanine37-N1)-methyltransferase
VLIDVISIFPEYLDVAELSLLGRAQEAGLVRLRTHDLRQWTHDRHRTVDDSPYGGGAGMVMRPEPWGEALDSVLGPGGEPEDAARRPVLLVPTPSGVLFTQQTAERLAGEDHLVFACGRYEGIDARVTGHYRARGDVRVEEVSIGDYVLAGGEAAALVMVEAITRLIPGVLGNAESLTEESHATKGLLEYPVYTKPPSWRGLDVPEVLLSGHHARVADWRRQRAMERTRAMRPDLAKGESDAD